MNWQRGNLPSAPRSRDLRAVAGGLFRSLSRPCSPGLSLLAGVLALVAALFLFAPDSIDWLGADWFVDEAHKISETKALTRFLAGDFHDRSWFEPIESRVNPPVPKLVAGAVILLSGNAIPGNDRIRWAEKGSLPPVGSEEVYLRARTPLRRLSLVVTSLIAGMLAAVAARFGGPVAAAFATAFFIMHYLPQTYATVAMNDPLLALLVFSTLLPLGWAAAKTAPSPRLLAVTAAASGVLAAAAFQTKLSGAIAAVAAAAAIPVLARGRSRAVSLAFLAGPAVLFVLLVNPWYWATAPVSLPATPFTSAGWVLRPLDRFAIQVASAEEMLDRFPDARIATLPERLSFVRRNFLPRRQGVLLVAGVLLALAFWRAQPRWLFLWIFVVVAGFSAWVPLAWGRYLLPALAPVALAGGLGWNALARRLAGGPVSEPGRRGPG